MELMYTLTEVNGHPDGHAQSLTTHLVSVGSRVRSTKSSES